MAKFDWSRVNLRVLDPARYLRSSDIFVTPDKTETSKGKKAKRLLPAALMQQLQHEKLIAKQHIEQRAGESAARLKRKVAKLERQRLAKDVNEKRQAQAKEQRTEAKRLKEVKRLARVAAVEAQRVAFAEYQKTPEYAAKVERERTRKAAQRKSHLQVWVEKQTGLTIDRDALRQRWRTGLLAKRGNDVAD